MSSDTPTRIEAVFDSSPLILLDFLGYSRVLPKLYSVIIPPTVSSELLAHPDDPGGGIPDLSWVSHQAPKQKTLKRVRSELSADPGEEEAVALAIDRSSHLPTSVVLDDLKARNYARRLGLPLVGTLGILLRLHRLELTERSLEEEVEFLEARGMYISRELKQRVLEKGRDRA